MHKLFIVSSLVPAECFVVERIQADTLQKAVLTGRVLETKQELVRLHLDMDREQDASKAYWFPWRPITGNLLYCMPEKGTKAGLYITGGEERTAEVVYSIRENGEKCSELADPNDRYLTTDHEKRMYLKPSGMGLANLAGNNAEVGIEDGKQLKVKTVNRISIQAKGQVELKGKKVTVMTPKEVTLVRKDILSPTVVNMQDVPYDVFFGESTYKRAEQISFDGAEWKGEDHGDRDRRQGGREQYERKQQERSRMERGIRFRRPDLYENTNRLGKTIGEMDRREVPIQPKATGDPYRSHGRTDPDLQSVGRAVTGRAGKDGDFGNTEKY